LQALMASSNAFVTDGTNTLTNYQAKLKQLEIPQQKIEEFKRKFAEKPWLYNGSAPPPRKGFDSRIKVEVSNTPEKDGKWRGPNGRLYNPCVHCSGSHFNDQCPKKPATASVKAPDKGSKESKESSVKPKVTGPRKFTRTRGYFVQYDDDNWEF